MHSIIGIDAVNHRSLLENHVHEIHSAEAECCRKKHHESFHIIHKMSKRRDSSVSLKVEGVNWFVRIDRFVSQRHKAKAPMDKHRRPTTIVDVRSTRSAPLVLLRRRIVSQYLFVLKRHLRESSTMHLSVFIFACIASQLKIRYDGSSSNLTAIADHRSIRCRCCAFGFPLR